MNPQQPYQSQNPGQQPPTPPYNDGVSSAPSYAPYTPSYAEQQPQTYPQQQSPQFSQTAQSAAFPQSQSTATPPPAPQQSYPYTTQTDQPTPAAPVSGPAQQMAQTAYGAYPGYAQQPYPYTPSNGDQSQQAYPVQAQQPQPYQEYPPQPAQPYGDQSLSAPQPPEPDSSHESFSVDYLNEIAPQAPPAQINKFAMIGLIIGVLVLAFGALAFLNGGQPNYTQEAQATYARIETLQAATKEHQSHLTENELSSMNATLTTSLGSMASELETTMKEAKIKTQLSGKEKEKEKAYADNLTSTLEDAYLTGTLDRVYARQMSYQLNILKSQLQKLRNASGNRKAIKDFYNTNSKTIDAATKSFNDFTSTK